MLIGYARVSTEDLRVATRESIRSLHSEHERASATGSNCAIPHFAEISAFARLRPSTQVLFVQHILGELCLYHEW